MFVERPKATVSPQKAEAVRSTALGRVLLFVTIGILPFQDHIPDVGGFSVSWFTFAAMGVYIGFSQARNFLGFALQPAFLLAAGFVAAISILEWSHEHAQFKEVLSIAQMFLGAMLIGSLVCDEKAVRTCVYAYVSIGLYISALLIANVYTPLRLTKATGISDASAARERVFETMPIQANLNFMAYTCGLASACAFVMALSEKRRNVKIAWFAVAGFAFVGCTLPLSRSGLLITLVLYGVLFIRERLYRQKRVFWVTLVAVAVFGLTPSVAFKRVGVETAETGTRDEGRVVVAKAVLSHVNEYAMTGVGVGAFWGPWGVQSDFGFGGGVKGSHNVFAQIAIYWGVFALGMLISVLIAIGKMCAAGSRAGRSSQVVLVFGLGSILLMMFMHNLYSKEFSIAIGVITGWNWWVKPRLSKGAVVRGR